MQTYISLFQFSSDSLDSFYLWGLSSHNSPKDPYYLQKYLYYRCQFTVDISYFSFNFDTADDNLSVTVKSMGRKKTWPWLCIVKTLGCLILQSQGKIKENQKIYICRNIRALLTLYNIFQNIYVYNHSTNELLWGPCPKMRVTWSQKYCFHCVRHLVNIYLFS